LELKRLKEQMEPGHLACAGCGAALAMKLATKALGEKLRVVIPASCWSIIVGRHPDTTLKVPVIHSTFEVAPSIAAGIRAALDALGQKEVTVMVWAGDGATYDIGFASLSAAAERDEDIIYVCYDNEAYMNTGIQRSSSTPYGAWTTTTPYGKREHKKEIIEVMKAHRIPYIATATVAYPEDMIRKFKKAKEIRGFRFILVLSPCCPGWGIKESETVLISRLAVESGLFPLLEIEKGKLSITHQPSFIPVKDYIAPQKRFAALTEKDVREIEELVRQRWERLRREEA